MYIYIIDIDIDILHFVSLRADQRVTTTDLQLSCIT